MKTFIFSLFLIVAACSSQKIEDKNLPSDDTTDKISTHKMEWEKNKEMQLVDELKTKSSISALNSQSITESSNGNFGMPAFSQDGQYLFYTNMDYSEIWRYNLKSNFSEKLVEMQSSGVNFQISFDGNTIYFRNKATSGKSSTNMYSILKNMVIIHSPM